MQVVYELTRRSSYASREQNDRLQQQLNDHKQRYCTRHSTGPPRLSAATTRVRTVQYMARRLTPSPSHNSVNIIMAFHSIRV